jgi:hypothetical protein
MNVRKREGCSLKAALASIAAATIVVGCQNDAAAPAAAPASPVVSGMAWTTQGNNWEQDKAVLQALGEQFDTSWAMYEKLKVDAGGGAKLTWDQMALPSYDWSGIYTRTKGGLHFDPDLRPNEGPASAKLTPEGQSVVDAKLAQLQRTGGEYDPISDCRPPGTPRWFTEPFLHEFVVTPDQAWLTNEMVNDTRRVYTDGRPHTADADAYATWNGDTVGFWDGDILVMHTKDLMAGQYQRGVQPNYSEDVTTVERWRKVDSKTLQADVWVFDPVNLAEPWYTRQSWTKLTNDDYLLRIRYWDCRENSNNAIVVTEEGTSQFPDFDFVADDAAVSDAAAVQKAAEDAGR